MACSKPPRSQAQAPKPDFDGILKDVRRCAAGPGSRDERLQAICELLASRVPHYHWVGFYLREPPDVGARHAVPVLVLGPYVGEPTEHVRIPFARGVCGQAAAVKQPVVVQDVSKVENYLACSVNVRAEIVVPIMKGREVAGEIDIDSHDLSPFSDEDRKFLEAVCAEAAKMM